MTNLDKALIHFKKAEFTNEDTYTLNDRFEIVWLEHERFIVNEHFFDRGVGHVTNDDVFSGDFDECLNFVLRY